MTTWDINLDVSFAVEAETREEARGDTSND